MAGRIEYFDVRSMAAVSAAILLLIPVMMTGSAFASQPYIGGYRDSSTIHTASQFYGRVEFDGSTGVSSYTGGVISMSGIDGTAIEPVLYQAPVTLETDDDIVGDSQVWLGSTQQWHQPVAIGEHGSGNADVDYVYYTFYWNGARTQVTFYYEPHFNDGTSSSATLKTYTRATGDDSDNFATGWQDVSGGGHTYRIKFLQFGAESGSSTSGWQIRQYDMHYLRPGAGTVDLEDVITRSIEYGSTNYTYGSWVSYDSGSGTIYKVGLEKYIANADYDQKSGSSLPPGEVEWYKDSSSLPAGTRLW